MPDPVPKMKPIELGSAWSILLLPLLSMIPVAAVLSIPYSSWRRRRSKRREKQFEEMMRTCGRTVPWDELEIKRRGQNGCIIVEWLDFKGPVRWWWVDDDPRATGLVKLADSEGPARLYIPTYEAQWKARCTGQSGNAILIIATQEQKMTVMADRHSFEEGVNALLVGPFFGDSA